MIPDMLQRRWLEVERTPCGYNLNMIKIEGEEKGPLMGWMNERTVFEHPTLAKEFLSKLYTKFHIQLVERSYQDIARKLIKGA